MQTNRQVLERQQADALIQNQSTTALTLLAPAKINLALQVTQQLVNGKHQLSSVFTTIDLADRLQFVLDKSARQQTSIQMSYADDLPALLLCDSDNTVYQAIQLFEQLTGNQLPGSLQIHVDKSIPSQAGLGGSSSDAACTLWALQLLYPELATPEIISQVACQVGADVNFFLVGGCMLMGGVGELPVQSIDLPVLDILVVKPHSGISTKEAYQQFDRDPQPIQDLGSLVCLLSNNAESSSSSDSGDSITGGAGASGDGLMDRQVLHRSIAPLLKNNLAQAAIQLVPEIKGLIASLKQQPEVLAAQVTGSGSAVFALCTSQHAAKLLAAQFIDDGFWAYAAKTTAAAAAAC